MSMMKKKNIDETKLKFYTDFENLTVPWWIRFRN